MWMTSLAGGGKGSAIGRRLNFEVQTFKADHWVIEDTLASEEEARALATKLLPNRDGVRIIRDFAGVPGKPATETIIFSEMREAKGKTIAVQPIDDSPVCTQSRDYLQADSRQTISKLLRQYLEDKGLTASELLYNAAEMKRAVNFENLVPVAVGRVASIQGKVTGQDVRERRDLIYSSLTDLRTKAEAAQKQAGFSVKQEGFRGALDKVDNLCNGDVAEADYLSKVILCRDLVQIRNMLGKVEWLLESAGDAAQNKAAHVHIIDTLVADASSFQSVIQDLLGRQPDLGTALGRMMDMLQGSFEPSEREMAPPIARVLSQWLGLGHAPQTWQVILESLLRGLRGSAPLSRDPERNRASFSALATRIVAPCGLFGGSRMADALTNGYLRFIEQGGGEGRRLSIEGVMGVLPTWRDRTLYLAELAGGEVGQREMETVVARLRNCLSFDRDVNQMVGMQVALKPKMQAMASLYTAVNNSKLPDDVRPKLADQIDEMVAGYISAAKVIERLDDPSANLRIRATRLMQFAANDVLSSPKARKMVRDQIVGHLRQPNFDGKFVEGLNTPEEQAGALRQFYGLLRQAQFM